jgi:hypothetical protein
MTVIDRIDQMWKPVPGYEGRYEVSDDGAVRSVEQYRVCGHKDSRPQLRAAKILVPQIDEDGYLRVRLTKDGARKERSIHSLVLSAYIGQCPTGKQGCHENGIRTDNRLVNLYWGTPKENAQDRVRHGRGPTGERNPAAKLNENDVHEVFRLRADGQSQNQIARHVGVSQRVIWGILNKKLWAHVHT